MSPVFHPIELSSTLPTTLSMPPVPSPATAAQSDTDTAISESKEGDNSIVISQPTVPRAVKHHQSLDVVAQSGVLLSGGSSSESSINVLKDVDLLRKILNHLSVVDMVKLSGASQGLNEAVNDILPEVYAQNRDVLTQAQLFANGESLQAVAVELKSFLLKAESYLQLNQAAEMVADTRYNRCLTGVNTLLSCIENSCSAMRCMLGLFCCMTGCVCIGAHLICRERCDFGEVDDAGKFKTPFLPGYNGINGSYLTDQQRIDLHRALQHNVNLADISLSVPVEGGKRMILGMDLSSLPRKYWPKVPSDRFVMATKRFAARTRQEIESAKAQIKILQSLVPIGDLATTPKCTTAFPDTGPLSRRVPRGVGGTEGFMLLVGSPDQDRLMMIR